MKFDWKMLQERAVFLEGIINEKNKSLQRAPEGSLQISRNGIRKKTGKNRIQYYHYTGEGEEAKRFIRDQERDLAEKLAQKDYDRKVAAAAAKEKAAIERCLKQLPAVAPECIYDVLSDARKELVVPILETDEMYVHRWQAEEYEGKGFLENSAELYTARGERVRSKSEVIIADMLYRENIPYKYECPHYLHGMNLVYTDFTILNIPKRREILWEHFGRMDDPDYAGGAIRKIAAYQKNGYFPGENLILSWETSDQPINGKLIKELIQRYCCS